MKRKTKIIICIVLIIVISVVIGVVVLIKKMDKGVVILNNLSITNVDLTKIDDGTYKGGYKVFPVEAQVELTVKDHKITDINLTKHVNGQGGAAEVLTEKVKEVQSLDVEIISGATYSSKVILKSIENALLKGK